MGTKSPHGFISIQKNTNYNNKADYSDNNADSHTHQMKITHTDFTGSGNLIHQIFKTATTTVWSVSKFEFPLCYLL